MKSPRAGLPKGGASTWRFSTSRTRWAPRVLSRTSIICAARLLARTIRAIDRVQAARVHLVLPEYRRASGVRETLEPSSPSTAAWCEAAWSCNDPGDPSSGRIRRSPFSQRVSIALRDRQLLADGAVAPTTTPRVTSGGRPSKSVMQRDRGDRVVGSRPGRARVQPTDDNKITETSDNAGSQQPGVAVKPDPRRIQRHRDNNGRLGSA